MFDIFANLISSKRLKFDKGEVKLLNTNVCLIPPEVYLELYNDLEKNANTNVLYVLSKESAKKWFSDLFNFTSISSKQEKCDFVKKALGLLAMGRVEIAVVDNIKCTATIRLFNSLMSELCGKKSNPVDVQFSGYLAGSFSLVFEKEVSCVESKCKSIGNDFCEFIIS